MVIEKKQPSDVATGKALRMFERWLAFQDRKDEQRSKRRRESDDFDAELH